MYNNIEKMITIQTFSFKNSTTRMFIMLSNSMKLSIARINRKIINPISFDNVIPKTVFFIILKSLSSFTGLFYLFHY